MTSPGDATATLDAIDVFDGVASVTCGDVVLLLWKSPARKARIERVAERLHALLTEQPDLVVCQFLLAGASPPDREGRVVARREALLLASRIRCAVMVPLGNSIWQAVVRSILRAAVRIAGHAERLKIAASEGEALDAITRVATPRSGSREQWASALEAMYTSLDLGDGRRP
ncbi:MAG: hypothetical protein WCJ30_03620 [Deltaproteobacteria bacterium]